VNVTFSSIRPDYDGYHSQLVNVMGVMTVKLTEDEAWKLKQNPDAIDEVMAFATANVDDARFTVTSWNWRNSLAFEGDEVFLDPLEWEELNCAECNRPYPCVCHD